MFFRPFCAVNVFLPFVFVFILLVVYLVLREPSPVEPVAVVVMSGDITLPLFVRAALAAAVEAHPIIAFML